MSNGMSGETQYIYNYHQDRLDRITENKRAAFNNYVNSYIKNTQEKRCTCSVCKAENSIHPVQIIRTSQGVSEMWKCDNCGREVPRGISNAELSYRLNVDRQKTTA